jgi:hypothetical protein
MASYRGHLAFSTALGVAYGALAVWHRHVDWGTAALGGGLAAVGGMLPDLDSDSGVPVRHLSGLAAAVTPCLLLPRLQAAGFTTDQVLVILGGTYLAIRYGVAALFKALTVHRGMFHSLPAALIAGLAVFLLYHHPDVDHRLYAAGGIMLGYLSHLVLDELCSVDFMGLRVRLAKSAGSALKFTSRSWSATLTTYALLAGLAWLAAEELGASGMSWRAVPGRFWELFS